MTKKTTSLTLAFSGVVLLVSSLVLYIGPPSHVGHFSPWRCLGLSKHHWGAVHLNSGILFCVAMVMHAWYNRRLLIAYVGRRKKQASHIPLAVSLALTLFVSTGSFHGAPPMKQVMGLARTLKYDLIQKYGSPPYGCSEAYPAKTIAGYMGWNPPEALARLKAKGILVASPDQSLKDIAQVNHRTIGQLLDVMQCPKGGHHGIK